MSYFISVINLAALFGAVAALQALLLNRMGLAFAAMTAFLGLGAYGYAALKLGAEAGLAFFATALILAGAMAAASNRLRHDYFLLATLAMLECLGAAASIIPELGGREGLSLASSGQFGGPGFELKMLRPISATLLIVLGISAAILASAAGPAIDRFKEHQDTAARWFPVNRLRLFMVILTSLLAVGVGVVYVSYLGRVTPRIFSIDFAILVLMFTVLAGRWPGLASIAALLYWVLPYWASTILPFSRQGAADGVRMVWGLLVVLAVVVPAALERRRLAQLGPQEQEVENGFAAG